MHEFLTKQFLPITREEAWQFFSSPKNLALITPPEMDFRILTPGLPEAIHEGLLIEYTVKPLGGIAVKWQTRIGLVLAPYQFSDIQEKGPYAYWKHTHVFIEQNGGTMMIDEINYKLPLGFIGRWIHKWFIRKKIEKIFEYRKNKLNKLFTNHDKRVA
jgi:ligand-binding SRPBCC domain-containing protein